jgi:hypothetical protein
MQSLFRPKRYGDGRVQVFGCSPGCLVLSILVSLGLTIAVNLVLWALA